MDHEFACAEELQDRAGHELVAQEERADDSGEYPVIVKFALVGPDEDHQEHVIEQRPGDVNAVGETGAHYPQGEADRDERQQITETVDMHRLKRPEDAGIARVRVVILRSSEDLEVLMVIIKLPADVPTHFLT